jgi:hypothetical protein
MNPTTLPALPSGKPTAWEEAIYAFLVEKRSRSGSTRTVESYARMLWPFFRVTTPDQVRSADVLAYAHGIGASGRVPSSSRVSGTVSSSPGAGSAGATQVDRRSGAPMPSR